MKISFKNDINRQYNSLTVNFKQQNLIEAKTIRRIKLFVIFVHFPNQLGMCMCVHVCVSVFHIWFIVHVIEITQNKEY